MQNCFPVEIISLQYASTNAVLYFHGCSHILVGLALLFGLTHIEHLYKSQVAFLFISLAASVFVTICPFCQVAISVSYLDQT